MWMVLGSAFAFDEVRFTTEFRRNSEIATVVAPEGTLADTASDAAPADATLSDPAASGAGARSGAVAWPSAVLTGAVRATVRAAGGAAHAAPPPATDRRPVGGDAMAVSVLPRLSCTVASTR